MRISFLNQKGGVGKTTLAVSIADALARQHNQRVLLIDADPQGSAMDWADIRNENTIKTTVTFCFRWSRRLREQFKRNYIAKSGIRIV